MQTKICSKCNIEKDLSSYYFYNDRGYHTSTCKECWKKRVSARRNTPEGKRSRKEWEQTPEAKKKKSAYDSKYREKNKEQLLVKKKNYYIANRDKLLNKAKNYYIENKEKVLSYHDEYRENNQEKIKLKQKNYYENNKEQIRLKQDLYNQRPEVKKKRNDRLKSLRSKDPKFFLTCIYRSVLKSAIKRDSKTIHSSKRFKALGYSSQDLKEHLSKQFTPEMTFENYGDYWHIDHIKPISSFDYKSEKDENFKLCWSLNNLCPLKKEDNILKGSKVLG